jgi:hypothetical protein
MKWNKPKLQFLVFSCSFLFLVQPLLSTFITAIGLSAYVFYLPRIFINFKKSFTFGEGCLILQALI